jgi:penicillin-binding protein A
LAERMKALRGTTNNKLFLVLLVGIFLSIPCMVFPGQAGNPRPAALAPFTIVDRNGVRLAYSNEQGRKYPYGKAAFPVTGHSKLGTSIFLESDMNRIVRSVAEGDAGLEVEWLELKEMASRLLQGKPSHSLEAGDLQVRTTIDITLQQEAMKALHNRNGAIIMMSIPDGEIMALASIPTFDPDQPADPARWDNAFKDKRLSPGRNRALHMRYPPGSLMKLVTAAAILEYTNLADDPIPYSDYDAKLDVRDMHRCGGKTIGFDKALEQSSNVYFGRMGVKLGSRLMDMAERLGFGEPISLVPWLDDAQMAAIPSHVLTCQSIRGTNDKPQECSNESPWSTRFVSEPYLERNPKLVARAAFGQTVVEVTPLQMALVTAAIACEGKMPAPRIVKSLELSMDKTARETLFRSSKSSDRVFSRSTAKRLTRAMEQVYAAGTASKRYIKQRLAKDREGFTLQSSPSRPVRVAAKTGTAENAGGVDHAWFTAFAPADAPKVAVLVFVENGGLGGLVAGPIGMTLLRSALWTMEKK